MPRNVTCVCPECGGVRRANAYRFWHMGEVCPCHRCKTPMTSLASREAVMVLRLPLVKRKRYARMSRLARYFHLRDRGLL